MTFLVNEMDEFDAQLNEMSKLIKNIEVCKQTHRWQAMIENVDKLTELLRAMVPKGKERRT